MKEYGYAHLVKTLLVGPPGCCIHGVAQIEHYCSVAKSSAIIDVVYVL